MSDRFHPYAHLYDEPPEDPYPETEPATPPVTPVTVTAERVAEDIDEHRPVVYRLSEVKPERVDWLWRGFLPAGKLVTLDGDPGLGKSTLALDFSARVSTGTPWPDGAECGSGAVLLLSAEDGLADTIRPRLDAGGADASRVYALSAIPYCDDNGTWHERPPVIPIDLPVIAQLVERHKVRLVVVDVLMAYLDAHVNAHRDQDVRRALAPLARLADRTGACVVVLRHLNKSVGGPVLYRGGGSIGIVGAARVGLVTVLDPDDDTEATRVLAVAKNNLAPVPEAQRFQLVPDDLTGVARVHWLGADPRHVNDLMAHHGDADERTMHDEAAAWLQEYLTDCGGSAHSEDVKRDARVVGIAQRTLERARTRAGVETRRDGFGKGARYVWSLPDAAWSPHARRARQPSGDGEQGIHGASMASTPDADVVTLRPVRDPVCASCGEPMTPTDPGQTTHPGCEETP